MGILGRAFAVALMALAGCYSPSLRDCKVSCAAPGDCAGDQVCGEDGLCAAPELAGQCGALQGDPIDAAARADAAPRPDAAMPPPPPPPPPIDAAPPPIDAPPAAMVSLRVQVKGRGSVVVAGVGTCSSESPQKGDCTYMVPAGVERSAAATQVAPDETFTRWTSLVCVGQDATCMFTPLLFTSISAQFDHARPLQVR
jgi:hypothetical protein